MTEIQATAVPVLRDAQSAQEVSAAAGIRHEVFVVEQGLFPVTDRDAHDEAPETIHLVALVDGAVAGTVRIYPLEEPGAWLGDRLAVLRPFRVLTVGAGLVRLAVATASLRGGEVMYAHIQVPNVKFFERLGWQCSGPIEDYCGAPHQPMSIRLTPAL